MRLFRQFLKEGEEWKLAEILAVEVEEMGIRKGLS
jgi:hypothetical protein